MELHKILNIIYGMRKQAYIYFTEVVQEFTNYSQIVQC